MHGQNCCFTHKTNYLLTLSLFQSSSWLLAKAPFFLIKTRLAVSRYTSQVTTMQDNNNNIL